MNFEEKIKELEKKIEHLETQVSRLTISKLPNPQYPYYEWLVSMDIPDGKREMMEHALVILSRRLEKQPIYNSYKSKLPGISSELLYTSTIPNFEDVQIILSSILGLNNRKHVIDLLQAMYNQDKFSKLCRYLLDNVDKA
ncbi:hypothetical protein L1765_15495 [Microaerobacter geothermalis]|uniref:hypothetical protein n=1 Tax=Microaerobacter geothermalis TaxID=674972 RepID=UPI001F2BD85D|nr:hypothetical protein [Microaerobacter geothermalis]MCF6095360.1 hypothetical protein [Microaerobacter geothermalis]